MVDDQRLIHTDDGQDPTAPANENDADIAGAVNEYEGVGDEATLDPNMERSMTDDEGVERRDKASEAG